MSTNQISELLIKINQKYNLKLKTKYLTIKANDIKEILVNLEDVLGNQNKDYYEDIFTIKNKDLINYPIFSKELENYFSKDWAGGQTNEPETIFSLEAKKEIFETWWTQKLYNIEILCISYFIHIKSDVYIRFITTGASPAYSFCKRWLDGLNPLFIQKPETVLQELIEVLESLIID